MAEERWAKSENGCDDDDDGDDDVWTHTLMMMMMLLPSLYPSRSLHSLQLHLLPLQFLLRDPPDGE